MNGYLTLREAADIMRVSAMTVRRWVKAGKLPFQKAGRKYLIAKTDIPTFLRQHDK